MDRHEETAIILIHCPDQKGLVAAVTAYLYGLNANILELDQYVDHEDQRFFMRVKWDLEAFQLSRSELSADFKLKISERFQMSWQLYFSTDPIRMAIFVSKMSHCLFDLLQRYSAREWNVEIPLIVSNHSSLQHVAKRFDIPFHVFSITKENKIVQERKIIDLMLDHQIDLIVLARYMQIITEEMIGRFPNRIINIHHSFLPAFVGARPYHQAYARGVKIIGATSHYVTEQLDAGPIIAQGVEHVSHNDSIKDLVRKGKDLEKLVLAKAVWHHVHYNILPFKNRTIVFNQ